MGLCSRVSACCARRSGSSASFARGSHDLSNASEKLLEGFSCCLDCRALRVVTALLERVSRDTIAVD